MKNRTITAKPSFPRRQPMESPPCKIQDARISNEIIATEILKVKHRLAPVYILLILSSTANSLGFMGCSLHPSLISGTASVSADFFC